MKKRTQKAIREMVTLGFAKNITNYTFEECKKLNRRCNLEKELYSYGKYGINGGLLKDRYTGDYYAITKRTLALAYFF